jgi:hypothetical protein
MAGVRPAIFFCDGCGAYAPSLHQRPEILEMRAETQKLVEEIKQSVELLRRSL